jgi:Protein kinase domain
LLAGCPLVAKLKLKVQGPWRAWHSDVLSGMLQRPDGGGVPVLVRYLAVGRDGSRDDGRLLSATRHPNVLRTLQLSMVNGRAVAVHEGFEGASAERVLQTLRSRNMFIPVRAALEVVQGVAEAIESAAAEIDGLQVVHPGPTPLEVLIDSQGKLKLAGFAVVGGDRPPVSGPAGYEAPEAQAGPKGASYGLGALLVELLAGERPSAGSSEPNRHEAMIRRALIRVLARPGENAPDGVINLVRQCMSRDPDERPSPGDVAARLTGLASGLRSPGLRAWAPGVVPTVLQIERVDAARASATIVPEEDMLADVPPATVPGPTRSAFPVPAAPPPEHLPASLPSPTDDASTQVLPRGRPDPIADDEESDIQPLIPPTQSGVHARRNRRVLLDEGPGPNGHRRAAASPRVGPPGALPPAGVVAGAGALPDTEPPARKSIRPRKVAPVPPAALAPPEPRGPLPLEEIGLGDDYVDAPTTVVRPDLPLPPAGKPATPLFEAQDLIALRAEQPRPAATSPAMVAPAVVSASPDAVSVSVGHSASAYADLDETVPPPVTAPSRSITAETTTLGRPAGHGGPSPAPRPGVQDLSPADDGDGDAPAPSRSGMRLGIGLLLGGVAAVALAGALGLAAWSMRDDDSPATDNVAVVAPAATVSPAADVLAGEAEPDAATLEQDAAAADQAAADQAAAAQAAADQAAADQAAADQAASQAAKARSDVAAAAATTAKAAATTRTPAPAATTSSARTTTAATSTTAPAASQEDVAASRISVVTSTTTAPAASSGSATTSDGAAATPAADTFRVEFRSGEPTVTELDVRCHVGSAKGPSPVVINDAGRGPCKVVGRGGASPVVAVVSLTGTAKYTCFSNGDRACN